MYYPNLEDFREKAQHGNLIPVYKTMLADMETPVSAFYKIGGSDHAFLLESVEGGEHVARYSFLGSDPSVLLRGKGNLVQIDNLRTGGTVEFRKAEDPLEELEELMAHYQPVEVEGLPRFHGGAVGYLNYDMVRYVEELPDTTEDDRELPDCFFMVTDTLLVFDHVNHQIKVVANAHINGDVDQAYKKALDQIDELIAKLKQPLLMNYTNKPVVSPSGVPVTSNFTKEDYQQVVLQAKQYIAAGDIIQVVPSQRFSVPISVDTFDAYRALRTVNPSPYMFYLKFDELQIAGASPEMMVRVEDGVAEMRPIAGTRPRGATPDEDEAWGWNCLPTRRNGQSTSCSLTSDVTT